MLEEKNFLNSDSKYYKVVQQLVNDHRWKALEEDREREQVFQDYMDDLYDKEKDERYAKS